eukprot:1470083-Amphidinium_carterae.1
MVPPQVAPCNLEESFREQLSLRDGTPKRRDILVCTLCQQPHAYQATNVQGLIQHVKCLMARLVSSLLVCRGKLVEVVLPFASKLTHSVARVDVQLLCVNCVLETRFQTTVVSQTICPSI